MLFGRYVQTVRSHTWPHGTPPLGYIGTVSPRSLLVVDTDPAFHQFVTGVLQRDDRRVQSVYEAPAALDCLRTIPFDLVLAEQGRNGSDSMKLLRQMRAIRPEAKVILTGEASVDRAIGAIRSHAYSYVHKPLTPGPLAEMVQQALDSSSWEEDLRVVSARPDWITVEVRCKLGAAERMIHLLREVETDLSPAACEDVTAAFRELLLNAIEHGGKSNPRKRVRVSVLRMAKALVVHMRDPGKGFSMEAISHAAVCNPEDAPTRHVEIRAEMGQRPGGFGILMARNLVDELRYNERGNEVVFTKRLARQ